MLLSRKRRSKIIPCLQDREQAFQERDRAEQEKADLRKALDDEKGKTTRLTEDRDNFKTKANELQKSRQVLEQAAEKKHLEYEKLKETTGYKNIQRMSDSLIAAYNKVTANKIAFLYESLDKTFKELTYEMTRFASLDPEVHAAYKKMVNDFLLKAMKERMGADNIHLEANKKSGSTCPKYDNVVVFGTYCLWEAVTLSNEFHMM